MCLSLYRAIERGWRYLRLLKLKIVSTNVGKVNIGACTSTLLNYSEKPIIN